MPEKILIVDDELSFREFLSETLEDAGYLVNNAGSGKEALEAMMGHPPDIMITDINMPEMNGIELMSNVKKHDPNIIIIVMTAYANLETARAAIKHGAYDFILKPFKIDEILTAINNATKRNQLIVENAKLKETLSLYEVSKTIIKTIALKDLHRLILDSALNLTKATRGSLMILDEKGKELTIKCSVGIEKDIVEKCHVKIGEGIAGRVAEEGKPIFTNDINNDPGLKNLSRGLPNKSFLSAPIIELEGERLLSIPLKTSKKLIGVLNISNPKSGKIFTESDLYLISILAGQAAISLENAQLFKNIEETYLSTMKTFSLMLEGKSPYTQGHSERVGEYAIAIAKEMQLNSEEINTIKQGAILHDIGKIGISDAILNKKGKLTNDEYNTIKKHPEIGFEMVKPIKFVKKALPIIKHHHERMDGKGYPDGKTGGNLSSLERICMVADAFDAMRSTRPYRKSLTEKEILNELESNAGTQFDKEVITALIRTEKSLFQERQNIENAIST